MAESLINSIDKLNLTTDLYPETPWLLGEKEYGQRFIFHETYISTHFDTEDDPEDDTVMEPEPKKVQKETPFNVECETQNNIVSMLQIFELQRQKEYYPPCGNSARHILGLFQSFSVGIDRLFPGGYPTSSLFNTVNSPDDIYIMLGIHDILNKLDDLLYKRTVEYIKNNRLDSNSLPRDPHKLMQNFINHSISKYQYQFHKKKKPNRHFGPKPKK